MLSIRHENSVVYAQDNQVKIVMTDLGQISEMIEKIKSHSYHMDEEGLRKSLHIIDLLNLARDQFIRHEEKINVSKANRRSGDPR